MKEQLQREQLVRTVSLLVRKLCGECDKKNQRPRPAPGGILIVTIQSELSGMVNQLCGDIAAGKQDPVLRCS